MGSDRLNVAILDIDCDDARLLARFVDRASQGTYDTTILNCRDDCEAVLTSGTYDIAFIDLDLGERSGLTLVSKLASQENCIPLIVTNGSGDLSFEAAISLGASDFLRKDDISVGAIKRTIHHTISARKTEQELRRNAEIAKKANEAKGAFLACMSHDLRTPLNAIIGFSEAMMLSATGDYNEGTVEYSGYINESGNQLLNIINTILDLTKIDEQKFVLNREWLDIDALITSQVQLLSPLLEERSLNIVTQFVGDKYLLLSDEQAVRQMLTNLISNAIKFCDEGSIITVATRLMNGGLEISVADRGAGMTGPEIKVALSPFGQVDRDPTIARKGTGLGLPIVKGLMEEHGGQFILDSRKGLGTSAKMQFPASCVNFDYEENTEITEKQGLRAIAI